MVVASSSPEMSDAAQGVEQVPAERASERCHMSTQTAVPSEGSVLRQLMIRPTWHTLKGKVSWSQETDKHMTYAERKLLACFPFPMPPEGGGNI